MPDCYIALGGNQGPVRETFSRALERLDQHPEISVIKTSDWIETAPVGDQTSDPFLNGAAQLSVSLSPESLLKELQLLETDMGRTREVRWGARPLDLDMLLYDQFVIHTENLVVPHPACWYRRFVLDPLAEIAADVIHPEKQITIQELRQRLLVKPFRFVLAGLPLEETTLLIRKLQQLYPEVQFSSWETQGSADSISQEPTLIAWLGAPTSATRFEDLPLIPRLDLSEYQKNTERIVHVLQSALDFR
ncbi:MAG: 2-amino-4-hydroxy-6-hydroxymethyldihydropteridine diphosphokinase [Gimesia sp.]|uniref:2-amino-4-hydroxy-6-hydroxymethyldihydropteridine pyrophosphokinase n=1 Tax=Gimesia maris TaxID=122 RepID=A0A3D3R508_9PLAN|nr:2-amino-4-hydroxy-6-hydroxymethyldihydropteridine diphosphokinase [Gimesia sp.]HCO23954.1 2-amino-4-hydroxy-6-hydroxymethyldihydropteridine diphosphokinase [Gimesia maris]|tara:strand:- start:30246 stop:30989 length:744 start_codon:yes stop_codon:yes gene_type:complete